jgi:hypothetical protein
VGTYGLAINQTMAKPRTVRTIPIPSTHRIWPVFKPALAACASIGWPFESGFEFELLSIQPKCRDRAIDAIADG